MPGKVDWWGHPGSMKGLRASRGDFPPDHHLCRVLMFNLNHCSSHHYAVWKAESLIIFQEICSKSHIMRMSKGFVIIGAIRQVACWSCQHCLKLLTGGPGSGRLQTQGGLRSRLVLPVYKHQKHSSQVYSGSYSISQATQESLVFACLFLRQSLM